MWTQPFETLLSGDKWLSTPDLAYSHAGKTLSATVRNPTGKMTDMTSESNSDNLNSYTLVLILYKNGKE